MIENDALNDSTAAETGAIAVPEITFESRLTEKGYRSVMLRVSLLRLRWIAPIAAFFIFNAIARGDVQTASVLGSMFVGTVVIIVLYANWASGSPSQRAVYDAVTYRTAPEGLEFESDERRGIVEWETVRRWESVKGHFLLHVGSASYVLVPETALDGVGGPPAFEAVLRERVAHGPRRRA